MASQCSWCGSWSICCHQQSIASYVSRQPWSSHVSSVSLLQLRPQLSREKFGRGTLKHPNVDLPYICSCFCPRAQEEGLSLPREVRMIAIGERSYSKGKMEGALRQKDTLLASLIFIRGRNLIWELGMAYKRDEHNLRLWNTSRTLGEFSIYKRTCGLTSETCWLGEDGRRPCQVFALQLAFGLHSPGSGSLRPLRRQKPKVQHHYNFDRAKRLSN
ncbi:hypothetical protein BGZ57DRAFT_313418 [Hyaloscypha finlandica]|nr:hypothetical protein BGZ57DRAFT_313418 [Hyaloscypha finlandica]